MKKNNYNIAQFYNVPIYEKETMIHIINEGKIIKLWSTDQKIYKRFAKIFGEPEYDIRDFILVQNNGKKDLQRHDACWTFNYEENRKAASQILSITNILPRKKCNHNDNFYIFENGL